VFIRVEETERIATDVRRLFEHCNDDEGVRSFRGWGPIPGVRDVRYLDGPPCLGAARDIINTDGTTHRELFTAFDPPRGFEITIRQVAPPFGILVREIRDTFALTSIGRGAELVRVVHFYLTSKVAYPLAITFAPMMRQALRAHHAAMKSALEAQSAAGHEGPIVAL
jgi:hypothetical protein